MSSSAGMFSEIHIPAERARALCDYGCKITVDHNIPARRYFRSGLEMIRMANVYYDEKDFESSFVLYSKFITLFVEKLPKHPGYKEVPATERDVNKKKLRHVFPLAEEIKKKLLKKYEKEEAERAVLMKKQAVELALLQERQRQEEAARRLKDEEQRLADEQRQKEEDKKWRTQQEAEYNRLQEEHRRKLAVLSAGVTGVVITNDEPLLPSPGTDLPAPPSYQSSVSGDNAFSVSPTAPTAPFGPSIPARSLKPLSPPLSPSDPNVPSVDRSTKPDTMHFTSTGGSTGNRHGLRDVIVPSELMIKFLNIALPNTTRNIETCGILCGKLAQNAFRITHLVVPKQSGTPDSCQTENEEELFDVQDRHDLITLGWIHTHPTQTAFLSSVDLHTHCSYQLMLPEAVAIVCAPKYHETGFFSLTSDHGMGFISNCRQPGFHPHPAEPPLFEQSGHVKLDNTSHAMVIDLRR